MATWKSIDKIAFSLERRLTPKYEFSEYQDVSYSWEYSTIVDTLTIITIDKQGKNKQRYGRDEAKAQLKILANWYAQYEGKDYLKDLLKEELSEDE